MRFAKHVRPHAPWERVGEREPLHDGRVFIAGGDTAVMKAWLAAFLATGLAVLSIASVAALATGPVQADTWPCPERQAKLRNLLTQDCGSCHGLTLGGGLGPSLQGRALAGKSAEYLAATILNGHPGTAMPPWRPFLTDAEAAWLAHLLKRQTP